MPRMGWAALLLAAMGVRPIAAQQLPPMAVPDHPPPILGGPISVGSEPIRPPVAPFPPSNKPFPSATATAPVPRPASVKPSVGFTIPASLVEQQPVAPLRHAAGLGVPYAVEPGAATAPDPVPAITPASARNPVGPFASFAPSPAPASRTDPVNDFLTQRTESKTDYDRIRDGERFNRNGDGRKSTSKWQFGERLQGLIGERGDWFRSDHAFDGFISPVSNPFLFEDPRSLTELRPIFMYQKIPGTQPDFRGGGISYFGVQGRLAFTDRLSFVINKLGAIWISPGSDSRIPNQSGFAELWFGPKYTFIRNENTGSLVAGGLQFQVPVGSQSAYQSNGTLSLVPYVSAAQNLFRDFSYGSFNVMGNTGYAISTTNARSDYWYISGHVDMDVLNQHRFYPLFEMNYFLNTTKGNTTNIGAEGRDLINFGGQASGKGMLTAAFGARYKIVENAQVGGAFELPIAGPHDLFQYRFLVDFILRY